MKILLGIIIFLGLSKLVFAQHKKHPVELVFSGGYASADLNWSIAGNSAGKLPNVLSEVKWEKLSGPSVETQLKIHFTQRGFISGRFSKTFIKSGSVTDSDYAQDNRQNQTYHADLRSNEGNLNDFTVFVGYRFFKRERLSLGLLAGYKVSRESLFLLNNNHPSVGEKKLRSTYQTSWKGFSTGLFADYKISSRVLVNASLIYSQLKYKTTADWNLIDAFKHPVSFTHYANGFDLEGSLATIYKLNNHVSLCLKGRFSNAETGTGIDQLFLESGSTQTTQFNGANRGIKSLMAGVVFNF